MSTKTAAKKAKPVTAKGSAAPKKSASVAAKSTKNVKGSAAKGSKASAKQAKPIVSSKPAVSGKPVKPAAKNNTNSQVKLDAKTKASVEKKPLKNAAEPKLKANLKVEDAPIKETFSPKLLNAKSNNKNDSLKFKEPHELFEGQGAEGEGSPDDKKEKKIKGVNFKIASGQEKDKWQELSVKLKSQKPRTYSMREVYEPHTTLQHKVLGWGVILSVNNDRLEVLFKEGIKFLISNYNP